MQVIAGFGLDHPAQGAGRAGFWKSLMGVPVAALLLLSVLSGRVEAQSAVLDGLRQTLASRWEFQKRFPLAVKAFSKELAGAERISLENSLRALPAAPAPVPGGNIDLPGMWREFALGLCGEAARPGSGEAQLQSAARRAGGNIPVNFELARILQGAGMFQRAAAMQRETRRSMLEQGYSRVPELAKMELRRAREALSGGRFQAARHSLEFAGRLDPFAPWVPLLAVEIHVRERAPWEWRLDEIWARLGDAAVQGRHYDSLSLFLLNLSRILRWGLGIFGCLCVSVLVARHFFRIAHAFAERLPHAVEMRVRYLVLAVAAVSLAVGGAGYVVLCMAAAAILWRHCSREERAILKAVLTGLAIMPLVLLWEQGMGRHLDSAEGIHLYHKAYGRGADPALAAQISAYRPRDAEDSLYRSLAGSLLFKKQGNLLRAGAEAKDALRLANLDPMARVLGTVQMGNLFLLGIDYGKASAQYSSAREAGPGMVEAWFNGSQAELYANNSGKHKQFLERAAEIDPRRVTAFLEDNDALFPSPPPNRRAMDPMLGPGQAWRAVWRGALEMEFLDMPVRSGVMEVKSGWLIAAVALLAAGLFFRFRNYHPNIRGKDLFECRICDRIMCRTCRKGVHCQSCFKAVAGVHDARLRTDLVGSLRNRARNGSLRAGRILDALVPGTGRLYLGEASGRFLWPLAASLGFGFFLGMRSLVMEYPHSALGPLAWLPALALLAVYGLHHLRFLLPSRPFGSKFGVSAPIQEKEAVS